MSVFIAATLLVTLAGAPGDRYDLEQWGPACPYGQAWDSRTVVTVAGVITAVEAFTPARGMRRGVRLVIATETGPVSVHLWPAWWVALFEPQLVKGE